MTHSTEVKIYPTPQNVCEAVAEELLNLTQNSQQPRFDIALSGGKTPGKLFQLLGTEYRDSIPWQRIHLWWGDERCVPPTSKKSNFKTANDLLITNISIPGENIHRIKGEDEPEKEALRYAEEIRLNVKSRGGDPVFDLLILGLGEDGHTASIFPDQIELMQNENICVVATHPITGQKRISLSGRVLNNANQIFFMVSGEKKSLRISEIMNDDEAAKLLPAYYISPNNGSLIWFIDEAAARGIS